MKPPVQISDRPAVTFDPQTNNPPKAARPYKQLLPSKECGRSSCARHTRAMDMCRQNPTGQKGKERHVSVIHASAKLTSSNPRAACIAKLANYSLRSGGKKMFWKRRVGGNVYAKSPNVQHERAWMWVAQLRCTAQKRMWSCLSSADAGRPRCLIGELPPGRMTLLRRTSPAASARGRTDKPALPLPPARLNKSMWLSICAPVAWWHPAVYRRAFLGDAALLPF